MLTDGRTDGRTSERTNRRKLARLCLPAKAGVTKIKKKFLGAGGRGGVSGGRLELMNFFYYESKFKIKKNYFWLGEGAAQVSEFFWGGGGGGA